MPVMEKGFIKGGGLEPGNFSGRKGKLENFWTWKRGTVWAEIRQEEAIWDG